MWMPEPAEPKLWKAWVATGTFTIPVAWSAIALGHAPKIVVIALATVLSFVAAYFVNGRMQRDWRATDTMAARHFDHHTGATRKYNVKKR